MPGTTDLDPKKVIVTFGGTILSGFADGTYLNFDLDDDFYNHKMGADGLFTRIRTNNNMGICNLTLLQSSPFNDILQGFYDLDRSTPKGLPQPFMVKNLLNTQLISTSLAWIKKLPAIEEGTEVMNREWPIVLGDPIVHVGGNALFS